MRILICAAMLFLIAGNVSADYRSGYIHGCTLACEINLVGAILSDTSGTNLSINAKMPIIECNDDWNCIKKRIREASSICRDTCEKRSSNLK